MTLRDWRAGQLRFLLVALMLSVAALSAVNFFGERMGRGLQRDAHQMLAADLVLASDQPLASTWRAEAQRRGLRVAETVGLLSMAVADGASAGGAGQGGSQLVALKSVEPAYPLRGQLMLRRSALDASASAGAGATGGSEAASTGPAPGTVWIDPALQLGLNLHQGSPLRIGERLLRVAGVIAAEPDAGAAFMRMAPRVMMASADLAATELLQQHAMARYRLLVAGEPAAVAGYHDWLKARFAADKLSGIQIDTLESGGSELHTMLDQARSFLSLVSLLSTVLAALAVAMAARRFMLRHVDACAMLACLGLTQGQVLRLYLIEFLLLGVAGSAAGVLCGFGAHFLLAEWLGGLLGASLPPPGWRPAAQGMATGMLLIVGFALAPLLQLRKVAPARLLRGERGAPATGHVLAGALGLTMFTGLLVWQTGDLILGLASAGGMLAAGLIFSALAWL
ncbi:ABC transporter permease, partial [Oxalobacteraceae bacterium]|nr:ABC transporter permease [Oxalobacteraceae bacterium]